jgi:hypothetical protein
MSGGSMANVMMFVSVVAGFLCEAHPATRKRERQTVTLSFFMMIEYSEPPTGLAME